MLPGLGDGRLGGHGERPLARGPAGVDHQPGRSLVHHLGDRGHVHGAGAGQQHRDLEHAHALSELAVAVPVGDAAGHHLGVLGREPQLAQHPAVAVLQEVRVLSQHRPAEGRWLAGLTQEQLAAATGLGRTVIAKIEAGSRRLAATELVAFAEALDRPVDWFFGASPPAVVSRRSDPAVGGQSRAMDSRVERIARDVDFLIGEGELPQVARIALDPPSSVEDSEEAAAFMEAWRSSTNVLRVGQRNATASWPTAHCGSSSKESDAAS